MSSDNLFTGHGGPMPKSRVLSAGFFGTVEDAFSNRSLQLSQTSDMSDIRSPGDDSLSTISSQEVILFTDCENSLSVTCYVAFVAVLL